MVPSSSVKARQQAQESDDASSSSDESARQVEVGDLFGSSVDESYIRKTKETRRTRHHYVVGALDSARLYRLPLASPTMLRRKVPVHRQRCSVAAR